MIPISRELGDLIESWQEKIDTKNGFILRATDKHGNVSSTLSSGSIQLILNSLSDSKHDSNREIAFGGHSFRVGAAVYLLKQGSTLE